MSTRTPPAAAATASKPPKPAPTTTPRPGAEGGKRDQNRKWRVETLLEASLPLFLERGIEGVTIDDIVSAAGIAKGTYYRYFEDKEGLVRALFASVQQRVSEAFDTCGESLSVATDPEEVTAGYLGLAVRLTAVVSEFPGLVRLYLQESRAPAIAARLPVVELARLVFAAAVRLTEVAHARGLLRPMNPRVSAAAVIGAAEQLLVASLSGHEPYELGEEPHAVIHALVTLVLDGLRPRS
jgi:AcrR family transcriptional regulator